MRTKLPSAQRVIVEKPLGSSTEARASPQLMRIQPTWAATARLPKKLLLTDGRALAARVRRVRV
jgi:hypothetical protein